jgi:hypothetical protein
LAVVAGGNYGADHEKIKLKAETKKLKPVTEIISNAKPNDSLEVMRYFGKVFLNSTIYCVFFD